MTILIGICGGSCSGKTTLAEHLQRRIGVDKCLLLRQDDYYHDIRTRTFTDALPNFDHPNSVDFDRLAEDLSTLKNGHPITPPAYDFETHHRVDNDIPLNPAPVIILEGILILTAPQVRALFDYAYFLKCEEPTRLKRRIKRDTVERGRVETEIKWQFEAHVRPSHQGFVIPSSEHADRIIEQSEYVDDIDSLCDSLIAKWVLT
ncbi:MAG: uridine kinase family protein [Alphaproteobacteria bacterium]